MITRRVPLTSPLDLAQTLAPLRNGVDDPTIRLDGREVWRAMNTPEGSATLRLVAEPGELAVEAWGDGGDWAADQVPALVGLLDDPSGFDPAAHPVVARLHHSAPGMRFGRTDAVVEALIPAVLGQRVTGFEARRSFRQIVLTYGEPAPGPRELRLLPAPQRLAGVPYYDLHQCGVERSRADTIRRVCAQANQLEELVDVSFGEARRRLTAVAGVGPWTAALTAQTALGDPDAVPLGDYGLPSQVAWVLAGESQADDARMLDLLEPWHGHRARVLRLIVSLGEHPPRRAPHAAIQDISNR